MEPTPWRSPNRRQALGANTATHKSTTRTSRITIVTPRRPTFALRKNPSEWAFTNGGCWGNAQRRPRRHFSVRSVCTLSHDLNQGDLRRPAPPPGDPSGGATPPPPVGASHRHGDSEAGRDARRGHHVAQP